MAVVGCSAPSTGVIYDKRYEPAYSYMDSQCTMYDNKGQCRMRMPVMHYVPEYWYLCLRDGDKHGCRNVDQITYHKYEIGQTYP